MAPESLTCTAGCVMEPLPERNRREGSNSVFKFGKLGNIRVEMLDWISGLRSKAGGLCRKM